MVYSGRDFAPLSVTNLNVGNDIAQQHGQGMLQLEGLRLQGDFCLLYGVQEVQEKASQLCWTLLDSLVLQQPILKIARS